MSQNCPSREGTCVTADGPAAAMRTRSASDNAGHRMAPSLSKCSGGRISAMTFASHAGVRRINTLLSLAIALVLVVPIEARQPVRAAHGMVVAMESIAAD